ncbi:hypothetical protein SESBI_14846 [Sesbania bispinosa]|nr:hypothetical protein SESBI_14846 [Sesbania bispinosa]
MAYWLSQGAIKGQTTESGFLEWFGKGAVRGAIAAPELLNFDAATEPISKASFPSSENIVLNCGSNTIELVQYDGRNWTGDIASPYVPSNANINSLIATSPPTLQSFPQVPYMTARIVHSQFTYMYAVKRFCLEFGDYSR